MTGRILFLVAIVFVAAIVLFNKHTSTVANNFPKTQPQDFNPLSIEYMRKQSASWRTGSEITIEETLDPGVNYDRYIASYTSDGLKIYALLTVPQSQKPKSGWPVIVFNHGYIPPTEYTTTQRYIAYTDAFSRNDYIVFKPDYRGNGNSEGQPEGAYYSPAYTVDVLNAVSSIKKYKAANPNKIGIWGHSMGGNITLRSLVVSKDIKAAVIWGGVVGSYDDLMNNWQRRVSYRPGPTELALRNRSRQNLIAQYKTPKENPLFWNSIDPTYFVSDIKAPVQLEVGGSDEEVPVAFSKTLWDTLAKNGKIVEYYEYPGDNHNISNNLEVALQRSVDFFDKYLK